VRAPHPDSLDSRYALTGWIAEDQIIGRAYALF
jgi:conjugal transfer pilin signal peptidase TrbI